MSDTHPPRQPWPRFIVAVWLTAIAGFVDAVGFLRFAHIYTANMSGNSVALGIGLGQNDTAMVVLRFWPVLTYSLGLVAGRALLEIGALRRISRIASVALCVEIILLAAVCGLSWTTAGALRQRLGVALLAVAMGMQNATLTKFSSLTIHTGFVTGTLVKMSEELVKYGVWIGRQLRQNGSALGQALARSPGERSFRLALIMAMVWASYLAGAAAGAIGQARYSIDALLLPLGAISLLVVLDLFKPLATREERAQSQEG